MSITILKTFRKFMMIKKLFGDIAALIPTAIILEQILRCQGWELSSAFHLPMSITFFIDMLPMYIIYYFHNPYTQTRIERIISFTSLFLLIGFTISLIIPTLNPHWQTKWIMETMTMFLILIIMQRINDNKI